MTLQTIATEEVNATELGATLLTVDDEPSVLSALRRLFRKQGYRILQATSGAEGLALLREHRVDVVVSDMRMPEMDGAQFLEAVRDTDPAIMRILLTGYADVGSTVAAINRGEIHRYIAKPWDDQDLLLVVRDTLARRELEQRNARLTALTGSQNEELKTANQTLESRVAARTAELQQVNGMLESAYEELNRNFMLAVTVFSGLLEMRENGIAGHSRRVAQLAQRTAARLGMGTREQTDVHLAALLHDIGKIGFPDHMFGKAVSMFTLEEAHRYRRHPVDGETALMPLAQLQGVARIVRQHHERVDGKGFPDGLDGEAICLGARIVAAASDYDGLVQGGHSVHAHSPERARQALRGSIGSRYDARVVEAILVVLDELDAAACADVEIDARDLQLGMVLGRDLVSPRGAVLLTSGYVFDARIIRQVCDFANRERVRLNLRVRRDSIQPPTALSPGMHSSATA